MRLQPGVFSSGLSLQGLGAGASSAESLDLVFYKSEQDNGSDMEVWDDDGNSGDGVVWR